MCVCMCVCVYMCECVTERGGEKARITYVLAKIIFICISKYFTFTTVWLRVMMI